MTDILAVGAHPDDVEIGAGGTLIKMRDLGYSLAIVTATDGEPTPFGTRETRLKEAAAAAEMLGAELTILDMPNRYLEDTLDNRYKLALEIRKRRPRILLAPLAAGAHPDHIAVSGLADAARFYSKLSKTDMYGSEWPGERYWPPKLYYYFLGVPPHRAEPKFVVNVTDVWDRKEKLLGCYGSQSNVNMHALAASHVWGPMIGVQYAEAFTMDEAVGISDLFQLT